MAERRSSTRSIRARFRTGDGDGVGDLNGIVARLPYLAELGVDALWLSPIFPSPMADFGYDIADYTGIDPLFGSMADFDALLAAAHALGLKLLLDFVPNHTSERHPWFIESRASRNNAKRDWYIWRDRRARWRAAEQLAVGVRRFRPGHSTSAPANIITTRFCAQQPDLNWRNARGARRHARGDALLA